MTPRHSIRVDVDYVLDPSRLGQNLHAVNLEASGLRFNIDTPIRRDGKLRTQPLPYLPRGLAAVKHSKRLIVIRLQKMPAKIELNA